MIFILSDLIIFLFLFHKNKVGLDIMNINNFKVTQYIYAPIHSIVSKPRQFITAALSVYASSLTGDFVETGVFRGGTSIIMARVLRDLAPEKKLFACDSFQGLPRIQKEDKPNKNCKRCNIGFVGQFSSSRKNFESYVQSEKLNNVKVIEGFYHVTLPPPSLQQISFLRLDGDIYNSTI